MSAGGRRCGERGQATVELALCLPVLCLALLLVVQVGLVVADQVRVTHAAREAARQEAVSADSGAARTAALAGSGLDPARTTVVVSGRGGPGSRVTVEVSYRAPTVVPLVGDLVADPTLTATATMRVEG